MIEIIAGIKGNAELVCQKLGLAFDEDSVKALDDFIEGQRTRMDEKGKAGLTNTLGSFLGECIIANFGGSWEKDESGSVYIQFSPNNGVYPFSKVEKQLANGPDDSVYAFYKTLPVIFK